MFKNVLIALAVATSVSAVCTFTANFDKQKQLELPPDGYINLMWGGDAYVDALPISSKGAGLKEYTYKGGSKPHTISSTIGFNFGSVGPDSYGAGFDFSVRGFDVACVQYVGKGAFPVPCTFIITTSNSYYDNRTTTLYDVPASSPKNPKFVHLEGPAAKAGNFNFQLIGQPLAKNVQLYGTHLFVDNIITDQPCNPPKL